MTPLARVHDGAAPELEHAASATAPGAIRGDTPVAAAPAAERADAERLLVPGPRTSRDVSGPLAPAVAERLAARLLPY